MQGPSQAHAFDYVAHSWCCCFANLEGWRTFRKLSLNGWTMARQVKTSLSKTNFETTLRPSLMQTHNALSRNDWGLGDVELQQNCASYSRLQTHISLPQNRTTHKYFHTSSVTYLALKITQVPRKNGFLRSPPLSWKLHILSTLRTANTVGRDFLSCSSTQSVLFCDISDEGLGKPLNAQKDIFISLYWFCLNSDKPLSPQRP